MDENYEKIIDLDNIPRNEVVLTDHNISVDVLKDHISKHISVLQRLINNYKSSCVQMKTDVFRYKEDILNYHNVVKDQWGKLNTVHREVLQYFMDNIADMQTQKGTLKEEVFNLRRELEQCTSKLSNSLNEMEEYGRKMSAVNAEFQTVKQDRSHLNLLLKEEKEQYNKILLENTYLKEEITKASKNILELEQQIEAANVDKDELSTNIEIIKLECKEYQEKLGETKCLNNNLHEKICNLQRENETVAVKLDELKMLSCQNYSDVELSRNKIISLEELLCNATREIENLRKQLETNENTISTLENLKNELEVELSKVKSSFESEQTNLHESLAQKTNDLTDLNNEYEKLKEDLCFKDDMIESLNKMLEEKANLDDDLLQQRGNDDALLIERTEEIQQLKTNLKLENEKNVALTQHVSDNAVKFQEMEKKYMDKLKIFEEMIAEKESADFDSKQQLNMNRHLALGLSNAKQVITSFKSELNALRQQFISNRHEYDHHINIVNNEIETRISEIQKLQEAQTVQNEDYMKSNENLVQDLKNQCSSLVHEKDLLQQKVMEYAHGAEKMEIQLKRQLNERLVELRNKTSDHLAVLRRQLQTMKSGVDIENEAFQTKLKEFYIDIEKKEESLRQEQQKGRELQADYEEKILILSQTLEEANQRANAKKNAIVEERRQFNSQLNSLKLFFEDGDQELSLTSESSNELKETSEGLLRRILGTTDESSGKEDVAVRQYIKLAESSNAAVLYLKNCISKLIDEKRSLEDINNSINQSLAANTIQIKELSNCHDEKLNALESQLESTKESHKEQLETQEKLHKDKMTDLVQKFKVKLKTISAECSELRLQKEEFQRQINALQEETVKLQEANYLITANANKNVEKLSLELEMSKSELSRLTSQLESLNEIDTLKENIRNFERVIQELEAKNIASATQYQQELLQVQEEIKVNLIVTEKLQRLNEDFEQQMTFKDKIEAELKLECEELKTVLEKTRKEDLGRIKELQDVIIPLKEEVNHLKLTITAKNDEISALESQINENASWNDEKTAMMIILDDLKTQLETQKHEFDDKIQSLEEMHDNTLKSKEQYFNEQTQIKLAELKKKAESRLLQIKVTAIVF